MSDYSALARAIRKARVKAVRPMHRVTREDIEAILRKQAAAATAAATREWIEKGELRREEEKIRDDAGSNQAAQLQAEIHSPS